MTHAPTDDFRFRKQVPHGDDRERLVCTDCGWVHYVNPRIVVGSVATWEDRFLLCRRAIEPRRGHWTLPAGFLEEGESPEEGALREAREEANAELRIDALLGIYALARISQVQIMYRAQLVVPAVSAGPESEEVGLFTWDDIPWDDLAFPTVSWALHHHQRVAGRAEFPPFRAP